MYAMKYGTVPVVRATGGLDDSVQEFDPAAGVGNGFKFVEAAPGPLVEATRRAVTAFARPDEWRTLVGNTMAADFSWERSAAAYIALYNKLLAAA
jgi:starch synthase